MLELTTSQFDNSLALFENRSVFGVFINYCVSLSALQTSFIKYICFLHLETEQLGALAIEVYLH